MTHPIVKAVDKLKQSATGTKRRVFVVETQGARGIYFGYVGLMMMTLMLMVDENERPGGDDDNDDHENNDEITNDFDNDDDNDYLKLILAKANW